MMRTHEDWEFIARENQELSRLAEEGRVEALRERLESCDWDCSALADFDYYTAYCGGHFTPCSDQPLPLLKSIPLTGRVLDVGFGYGFLLSALAERNPDQPLAGLDTSPLAVERQQSRTPRAELRVANAEQVPWTGGWFRTIIATELLEHLSPAGGQRALKEMNRVGTPDVHLLLSTRLNENLGRSLLRCPGCQSVLHPSGHVRSFSKVLLLAELSLAGWQSQGEPVSSEGGIALECVKL